jgi:hypothetical protein
LGASYNVITAGYDKIAENPNVQGEVVHLDYYSSTKVYVRLINNVNMDGYILPGEYYTSNLETIQIDPIE